MDSIITDIIKNSWGKDYISMSPEVFEAVNVLKDFNYENIYHKAISEEQREYYTKTIETLFSVYSRALDQKDTTNDIYRTFLDKMNKNYLENTSDAQKVIDYISGMTDNYLEREYEKYK